MAAVKYELFCRYYNADMKMPITNITDEIWYSTFEDASKIKEKHVSIETFEFMESGDPIKEKKLQELLIYGNNASNPKFNMFFMYQSRETKYSDPQSTSYPYVLMDRMDRVLLSPWFLHSTHSSLQSVMEKANALVRKIGHENIKIGKVVPLDQYIDIV